MNDTEWIFIKLVAGLGLFVLYFSAGCWSSHYFTSRLCSLKCSPTIRLDRKAAYAVKIIKFCDQPKSSTAFVSCLRSNFQFQGKKNHGPVL